MKIVVFSDSHGNPMPLKKIIKANQDADMFIHLGDGEGDVEEISKAIEDKRFLHVTGNCDWQSKCSYEKIAICNGRRIFCSHGHRYGVKGGLAMLIDNAKASQADIALFGHTHCPVVDYLDGIYVMNPGSVSFPRDFEPPSYGIIDITEDGIEMDIIDV